MARGFPAAAAQDVGTAQVIVLNVFGNDINRRMQEGQTLIRDQMVRTGTESAAELVFLDNSQLVIGARSEVTIDRFVFDPDANATKGSFNIVKGVLRFASAGARLNVVVNTRVATPRYPRHNLRCPGDIAGHRVGGARGRG
jgi:hypothetical protein